MVTMKQIDEARERLDAARKEWAEWQAVVTLRLPSEAEAMYQHVLDSEAAIEALLREWWAQDCREVSAVPHGEIPEATENMSVADLLAMQRDDARAEVERWKAAANEKAAECARLAAAVRSLRVGIDEILDGEGLSNSQRNGLCHLVYTCEAALAQHAKFDPLPRVEPARPSLAEQTIQKMIDDSIKKAIREHVRAEHPLFD